MALLEAHIHGERLALGDRFIVHNDTMLLADLHLGKTMHFRKSGFPVPMRARGADQSALYRLLKEHEPEKLIVLGDLFHSEHNSEVDELAMITSQFPNTSFVLVRGNHDVMPDSAYRSMDFETIDRMEWNGFLLTHEPLDAVPEGLVNMHGHIHPGVVLSGKGRQRMILPCFHLTPTHFCLPAFGALTGLMKVRPTKSDRVFGIIDGQVRALLGEDR